MASHDIENRREAAGGAFVRSLLEQRAPDPLPTGMGRDEESGHHAETVGRPLHVVAGQGHDLRGGSPMERNVADQRAVTLSDPCPNGVGRRNEGSEVTWQVDRIAVQLVDDAGHLNTAVQIGVGARTQLHSNNFSQGQRTWSHQGGRQTARAVQWPVVRRSIHWRASSTSGRTAPRKWLAYGTVVSVVVSHSATSGATTAGGENWSSWGTTRALGLGS